MPTTKTLLLAFCTVVLTACGSTPPAPTPVEEPLAAPPVAPAPVETPRSVVAPVAEPIRLADHLDPNSRISKEHSVYFDFDSTALKADYTPVIALHGKYLAANPSLVVRVEGNTDERGSAEYNLALGQKRAQTVVRALKVYGVQDRQLEAISYGEEKPAARGNEESAWSQNRRADIVYPSR